MTSPFWYNHPSVLLDKKYIFQLYPTQKMTFEEKLNAITKLVIILTIVGAIITKKNTMIITGLITLIIIVGLYYFRKQNITNSLINKESFDIITTNKKNNPPKTTTNPVTLETVLKTDFHPTTKKNPFGNVLITDIKDTPDRAAAAPSFNPDVYEDINSSVKKQTQMLNPSIKNTNKQIYGDLKDNYDLDNSMNRFYSTANTRVSNDQGAFSKYLYGDMESSKQDDAAGAMMRVKNNARYINM